MPSIMFPNGSHCITHFLQRKLWLTTSNASTDSTRTQDQANHILVTSQTNLRYKPINPLDIKKIDPIYLTKYKAQRAMPRLVTKEQKKVNLPSIRGGNESILFWLYKRYEIRDWWENMYQGVGEIQVPSRFYPACETTYAKFYNVLKTLAIQKRSLDTVDYIPTQIEISP